MTIFTGDQEGSQNDHENKQRYNKKYFLTSSADILSLGGVSKMLQNNWG